MTENSGEIIPNEVNQSVHPYIGWTVSNSPYKYELGNSLSKLKEIYGDSFDFPSFYEFILRNTSEHSNSKFSIQNFALILDAFRTNIYKLEVKKNLNDKGEYKFRSLYKFYKKICTVKNLISLIEIYPTRFFWFIQSVIKIDRSQDIMTDFDLQKIKDNLSTTDDELFCTLYFDAATLSNIATFLNFNTLIDSDKKSTILNKKRSIISCACRNSDSRVLDYVMSNFEDFNKFQMTGLIVSNIVSSCFSSNISNKYSFRRLKKMNEKIDFNPFFENMIDPIKRYDIFMKVDKFYGKDKTLSDFGYDKLLKIVTPLVYTGDNLPHVDDNTFRQRIGHVLNTFSKKEDKGKFLLTIFSRHFKFYGFDYLNFLKNVPYRFLSERVSRIVERIICRVEKVVDPNNYRDVVNILRFCGKKFLTKIVNHVWRGILTNHKKVKYCTSGIKWLIPFVRYFEFSNIDVLNKLKLDLESKVNEKDIKSLKYLISKFVLFESNEIKNINKIMFSLRIFVRKYCKLSTLDRKVKMTPLLDEIKYYKPNKNCSVLKNGSRLYRINKQCFTKVPPRHVMPFELKSMIGEELIIREKADGVILDVLPYNVEPNSNKIKTLKDYDVKAEFIEYLDLYLPFDINLNDDDYNDNNGISCVIDRYNYLRSLHYKTKDHPMNNILIESYDDLKDKIDEERVRFREFLSEDYSSYRFYPKGAWRIKLNDKFLDDLESTYFSDDTYDDYEVGYDGFIISPLNGRRELKLKPLVDQTIDLMYSSKLRSFSDREKVSWDFLIDNISSKSFNDGSVYRFKPDLKKYKKTRVLNFCYDSDRYDKKKPNTNKIVNSIIQNIKFIFKSYDNSVISSDMERLYYNSSCAQTPDFWNTITKEQNILLNKSLKKIIPTKDKNWLDLGCGSSRLLKFIRKYSYRGYLGIDKDINQLIIGMGRIDDSLILSQKKLATSKDSVIREERVRLINGDLKIPFDYSCDNYIWDSISDSNILVRDKFDYIVCNFSISHFMSDTFLENLNKLTKKGSIMIFNCVNQKIISNPWVRTIENNSIPEEVYMKYEDDLVKIKFHIHEVEVDEKYMSREEIKRYLSKFDWEIDSIDTPKGNDLESYYDWYTVSRAM